LFIEGSRKGRTKGGASPTKNFLRSQKAWKSVRQQRLPYSKKRRKLTIRAGEESSHQIGFGKDISRNVLILPLERGLRKRGWPAHCETRVKGEQEWRSTSRTVEQFFCSSKTTRKPYHEKGGGQKKNRVSEIGWGRGPIISGRVKAEGGLGERSRILKKKVDGTAFLLLVTNIKRCQKMKLPHRAISQEMEARERGVS